MAKKKFNRIKTVLADKERTGKWLAEKLGKDRTTVSRWCTNDMQPSIETFFQIAEILDVNVYELIVSNREK